MEEILIKVDLEKLRNLERYLCGDEDDDDFDIRDELRELLNIILH